MDYSDIVSFTWYEIIQGTNCSGQWEIRTFMKYRMRSRDFKPVLVANWRDGRKATCSEDNLKVIEDYFLEHDEWWAACENIIGMCKEGPRGYPPGYIQETVKNCCRSEPRDENWSIPQCENC